MANLARLASRTARISGASRREGRVILSVDEGGRLDVGRQLDRLDVIKEPSVL